MSEKVVQRLFAFIAVVALVLGMSGTGQVSAQDTTPRPQLPGGSDLLQSVDLSHVAPLIEKGGIAKVVVMLEEPSLATLHVQAQENGRQMVMADAQTQLSRITREQDTVQARLESAEIGGTTLFRNQRVYNGIALKVDAGNLSRIAALPGVSAIYPLETHTIDNAYAADLIGAKDVWDSVAAAGLSYTGKNVSIAVIDTGIDFLHTNFGGPGNVVDDTAYADAEAATDGFTTEDTSVFPTAKVVGGWDFVGDDYDASEEDTDTPVPDPIPMDCNGHGSHVAGSAAGFGVNDDGTTYTGPWTSALDTMSMRIGPGMAPQAELYALRVFGCGGSTNVTDKAIDWALDPNGDGSFDDQVDIINMSLGSDFGAPESSSTLAADMAVRVGVIVVASSGNAGDTSFISGSPAVATRAINVAATMDAFSIMDGYEVNTPEEIAGIYGASAAVEWPTAIDAVTGNLKYPADQTGNTDACAAFPPNYFEDQIALIDWTLPAEPNCGSVTRANNATAAGAIGVLMIYDAPILEIAITGSSTVPSMITTQANGAILKSAIAAGDTVNVTLDSALNASVKVVDTAQNDLVASFSSRGPSVGEVGLKPDIAAPGMTIFSTATGRFLGSTGIEYGTGEDGASFNGTSMASPIVAGSMAILREQHPDWTAEELKALVMNTATSDVYTGINGTGQVFSPVRVGAGRIDVVNATSNNVIAYNDTIEGAVSVSFGSVEVSDLYIEDIVVTVSNKGDTDAAYNMAYRAVTDNPGITFAMMSMANTPVTSITVEAGTSEQFKVQLTASAEDLRNVRDLALTEQQETLFGVLPRIWLSDESGLIEFSGDGLSDLRLPVHVVARPVSDMQSEAPTFRTEDNQTGTINVNLTGTGVDTIGGSYDDPDTFPENIVSLVSVFELAATSERLPTSSRLNQMADLQAVGIATDATVTTMDKAAIYIGIATYGEWNTPAELEFDVYFDVNQDGTDDFVLFTIPIPTAAGDNTDVLLTYLVNLSTGSGVAQDYINYDTGGGPTTNLFNNNVMVLPVYAARLGLTDADATFDYSIETYSVQTGEMVDNTEVMTYDAANPILDVSGGVAGMPTYFDLPDTFIPITYDRTGSNAGKDFKGVLLLHHHNAKGTRVETLVTGHVLYMPVLSR